MFYGEFYYRIDEKGRVPIPPRFRPVLDKEGIILAPSAEKCITVYPLSQWKKLAESLTSGPTQPSKLRKLQRALFATAFPVQLDGQGRMTLPPPLKQYAGIKDEVAVIGVNSVLELWDKDQWEQEKTASQEATWQIIESMEKR